MSAIAETLTLLATAEEGRDLRPIARRFGRELMRGIHAQDAAVIALGALMAVREDRVFEDIVSQEVERRGMELVRLGLYEATRVEASVAAYSLLEQLPEGHRRAVLNQFAEALVEQAPEGDRRGRMASLFLSLPLAARRAFLEWADEAVDE